MKKLIMISVVVGGIALLVAIAVTFVSPENNGKDYVAKAIEVSKSTEYECAWSGFVYHRKSDLTQVFLACNVIPLLSNTEITTQEGMISAIHEKVISPLLLHFPEEQRTYVTVIGQVQKDVVLCIDVKQKSIVSTTPDTYENYCWPA